MVGFQGSRIVGVPLAEATAQLKTVPDQLYETARTFFG
jgi:ATP-dependent phosphofructokinase / diphosphate-dependent phosphofructokinase